MTTIAQQLEKLEQDMCDATTPANGDPLVLPVLGASVRIWADRLSAIRAAVGGEAVVIAHRLHTPGGKWQWMNGMPSKQALDDSKNFGWKIEYAYASPPATVDVGANDFLDGMIATLGCLWLGFGYGPGTAEYDEVLDSAGRAKVLERAKTMHPDDIANAGLAALIGEKA